MHCYTQAIPVNQVVCGNSWTTIICFVCVQGAADTDLPSCCPWVQVFMWHGLCKLGHDACMDALLWSGGVWSEFTWSWSCDAFQGRDAFMARRVASSALSWLGVSVPPWETVPRAASTGMLRTNNLGQEFLLVITYLLQKKITFLYECGETS